MNFEQEYRRETDRIHAPAGCEAGVSPEALRKRQAAVLKRRRAFIGTFAAAAACALVLLGTSPSRMKRASAARASAETAAVTAPEMPAAEEAAKGSANALFSLAAAPEAAAGEPAAAQEEAGRYSVPADYEQLYGTIRTLWQRNAGAVAMNEAPAEMAAGDGGGLGGDAPVPAPAASYAYSARSGVYGTDLQVAGVDEADVVKTDGRYLYALSEGTLTVIKADGKLSRTVCSLPLRKDTDAAYTEPRELYLCDGRLCVITQTVNLFWTGKTAARDKTNVLVFDLADPEAPAYVTSWGQSGSYVSSRLAGGILYLITCDSYYGISPMPKELTAVCPLLYANGEQTTVPAGRILIDGSGDARTCTVISSMRPDAPDANVDVRAVYTAAGTVYMNEDSLLLCGSEYVHEQSDPERGEDGRELVRITGRTDTSLLLFSLSDGKIQDAGETKLSGELLNRYSLDIKDGVLRAAVTDSRWNETIYTEGIDTYEYSDTRETRVLTFSCEDLRPLGSLTLDASDEWIESVRFIDDFAYVCTFRTTDPLFAVDLSDPASPVTAGALKLPGFSEYLRPFGEGKLLGIGYNADTVTGSRFGVKISLFGTEDPSDLKELASAAVPADYTPAGDEPHCALVLPDKSLAVFPAGGSYFVYSYDDDRGFTLIRRLELPEGMEYNSNVRCVYIDGVLYFAVPGETVVLDLERPDTVAARVQYPAVG